MTDKRYLPEGGLFGTPQNTEYISSREMLERAMREGRILEALAVKCDCTEMTLTVDLGGMNGYIKRDSAAYSPAGEEIKDIAVITRVGHAVAFTVTGFFTDADGRTAAMLSRAQAQKRCFEDRVSRLVPGDIIPVRVTHLESFGAFVDIGCGLVALMTVDTLSVSRISHPRERVAVGEKLWAAVRDVGDNGSRIYMSLRELLGTWEENAARFAVGQTADGIIRSVEPYGVFVELTPNLAGLAEVREGAEAGLHASVYIKNIIPEKMKIKLVIVDTYPSPRRFNEFRYCLPEDGGSRLDYWRYSPLGCEKCIETFF